MMAFTQLRPRPALRGLVLLLAIACANLACGSRDSNRGDAISGSSDSSAEQRVLEIWTPETGTRLRLVQERAEEFAAAHPNVKINFTIRDFGSYPAQLKLALASDSAPDVVIGNLGWSLDGPLIKAGMLRPLDAWAKRYRWDQRFPAIAQRQMRFSADGKRFGSGPIFGVPYGADIIGWFYNVDKLKALQLGLPNDVADLEAAFEKARAAGEVPVVLGNKPQWPGLHVFYLISNTVATDQEINGIVFGDRTVSWTNASFVASARKLAHWNAKGFIGAGANSLSPEDANAKFARGTGVFLPAGTWNAAELAAAMGDDVGFFLMPAANKNDARRATGSIGYGWHITTASRNADLAAEFIDFMTNEDFAQRLAATGDIPPFDLGAAAPQMPSKLARDIHAAWRGVLVNGTLMPYLDFSAPNGAEIIYPTMQSILAGVEDPERGLASMESSRTKFLDSLR
jgi:ABC-type glycerol-3-phosphate transport system substrate-binding protein